MNRVKLTPFLKNQFPVRYVNFIPLASSEELAELSEQLDAPPTGSAHRVGYRVRCFVRGVGARP